VKKPSAVPPAPPADGITADAYIVGNLDTGDVYLAKNADAVLPFASMSKLITALVSTNIYSTSTPIAITKDDAAVAGDISHIGAGETFAEGELLYPLLMTSSNIAAEALASSAGPTTTRAGFMKLMNDYSWEIGMPHAFFQDPSGLDSHNAGTARGFLAMAQYLYKSRPDILAITRTQAIDIATTTEHGGHAVVNIHPYAADPRFLGGKTGHTNEALYTMLTILKISGQPVAFIVLRSDDRAKDTDLLIEKLDKAGMKPISS
jgi:D-alanyl-D-alanine carboxypeptidase (penicillin-binding protein 5/6)